MKRKGLYSVLIAIIFIAIFAVIAFLLSSFYVNRFVRLRLQEELAKQTHGEYMLSIQSLNLNLLSQSITFKELKLKPDNVKPEDASYKGSASQINFHGLNVLKFIMSKQIIVDRVELVNPSVIITQSSTFKPVAVDTTEAFSLYNYVSEFSKSVTIGSLEVTNFDLQFFNKSSDSLPSLRSNDNHFKVTNLEVGPHTQKLEGMFKADTVALTMNRVRYTTSDSLYTFDVKKMQVSYADSALFIDSMRVIPNYNKQTFAKIAGKQTDRFNIVVENLFFKQIDLKHFFERHGIISSVLNITNFSLVAFRDKNDTREFAEPKSVQAIIKESPVYLKIDTVNIYKSILAIEEISAGKNNIGRMTFNDINGIFTGITNDSLVINDQTEMRFSATCKVMNKAVLSASYRFPLNTSEMVFDCKGFITGMPMTLLNKMVEPTTGVSIKSGFIDTLDFQFHANDHASSGRMRFIYKDLKLQMPKSDENNVKGVSGLMLFVANNFIIKESNPKGNKPARLSSIQFVRNKQRFMFHYTWNSVFSGIKDAVGLPDKKQ